MSHPLYVTTECPGTVACCSETPSPFTVPSPVQHRRLRRPRPPLRSTSSEISGLFGSKGYASSCDTSRQNSVDEVQEHCSNVKLSQQGSEPEFCLSNISNTTASGARERKSVIVGKSKEIREDSGVLFELDTPSRTSTPVEAFSISHDFAYDGSYETELGLEPALKGRLDPLALTEAINFLTLGDASPGMEELDDRLQGRAPTVRVEPGVVVFDGKHWLPKDHAHWQRPEWSGTTRSRKCNSGGDTSMSTSAWKVTTAGIVPAYPCPSLSEASTSPISTFPTSPSSSDDNISTKAIAPFSRRASRRNSDASNESNQPASALPSTTDFNDRTASPSSLPDLCPEYCDAIVDWAAAARDMHDAKGEDALETSRQKANKASKAIKRSLDAAFAKEFNCKRRKIREWRKRRYSASTGYTSSPYRSEDEIMLEELSAEESAMRRSQRMGSIDEEWLQPERTEYFVLT